MSSSTRPSYLEVQLIRCSVLATGVFVGAMVLIALAVVSFWESLDPVEFQAWFEAHAFRLGRVMIPLGALSFVASVLALIVGRNGDAGRRRSLCVAIASLLGVVFTYVLFVHPINAQFLADAGSSAGVSALLDRWQLWHWVRVALGGAAFVALVRASEAAGRDRAAAIVGGPARAAG